MNKINIYISIVSVTMVCLLAACKPWDERISTTPNLELSLAEVVAVKSNVSKFNELLTKTGYDKIIASSQNFTVFAPSNDALQSLDASILNDADKLKAFVGNHIANLAYYNRDAKAGVRLKMLNGKYVNFTSVGFDVAKITEGDLLAKNGTLHVLSGFVPALPNLWEYINSSKVEFKQNDFVTKLTYLAFDPTKAVVDSISSLTGRPVYKPGTGLEQRNTFSDRVFDFKDEAKEYTYFILNDATLASEVAKLSPFFKTSTTDSTYNQTAWAVVQDLAVEGNISLAGVQRVISKFGVGIPILGNAVRTVKLSNGVAYVLDKMDFKKEEKIKTYVVEGENVSSRLQATSATTTFIRNRQNPTTKANYTDIGVVGHGITNYWLGYQIKDLPSVKYKVFWVAPNDNVPVATVNQRLLMGSLTATNFAYIAVPNDNYTEVLLGEFTNTNFGTLNMFLMANGTNAMVLDYIKLVPVF